MTNPFDVIVDRIDRVESLIFRIEGHIKLLSQSVNEAPSNVEDRNTPATRSKAAEYLGLSRSTIDQLVRSKQLKVTKIGRAVRFQWSDLDAFIKSRKQ